MLLLVNQYCDLCQFDKAKEKCQLLLQSLDARSQKYSEIKLEVLTRLGFIESMTSDYTGAEKTYKRLANQYKRGPYANRESLASTLLNLGRVHLEQTQIAEAEENLRNAAILCEKSKRPGAKSTFALVLRVKADCEVAKKNYAEAESLLKRAISIYTSSRTTKHDFLPELAQTNSSLAHLLIHQNRMTDAEDLLRKELSDHRTPIGPQSIYFDAQKQFASVLKNEGKVDEALDQFIQLAIGEERSSGPKSELVASALLPVAQIYAQKHLIEPAEETYKRICEIEDHVEAPDLHILKQCLEEYIQFLQSQNNTSRAESFRARLNSLEHR